MSYKGYDLFYVNGSSYTMGGGLEDTTIAPWNEKCLEGYKTLYNVSWNDTRTEANYGAMLSKLIGIQCINEAECGGGLDRVIRMTYEFLEKNWDNRHRLFLFLEMPDPGRSELYYNEWNKYFICNSELNTQQFAYATPCYNPRPEGVDDVQKDFKHYFEKFHNTFEFWKRISRDMLGLYLFCKSNNIAIKLMHGYVYKFYDNFFNKNDLFYTNILGYARDNNKFVRDEVKGYSDDTHPGYFAHQEYAKILKHWLDQNLENSSATNQTPEENFNQMMSELRARDPFYYETRK